MKCEIPLSLKVLGIDVPPDVLARLEPRPPQGWNRPATKPQTKCQVLINQEGRCKKTGAKLASISNVRFDHRPAVWQRMYDPVTNDTVPSVNDPRFIDAILVEQHDKLTHGSGGDTRTGDIGAAARDRRVSRSTITDRPSASSAHMRVTTRIPKPVPRHGKRKKSGRRIPSRPFPKRQRPMRSRRSR